MDYEEDEEEVGEEVEAMKAVYETDCVILRSIPPHFHLSLKPRTADVSYDQVRSLFPSIFDYPLFQFTIFLIIHPLPNQKVFIFFIFLLLSFSAVCRNCS